jgi:excisionase family DNA binding protein
MMDAMNTQNEKWLRPAEVAEQFRVSEESVRRWVRDGELRAIRLGSSPRASMRVPASALDEFIQKGT